MLLMTSCWFHSPPEKMSGLASGILGWASYWVVLGASPPSTLPPLMLTLVQGRESTARCTDETRSVHICPADVQGPPQAAQFRSAPRRCRRRACAPARVRLPGRRCGSPPTLRRPCRPPHMPMNRRTRTAGSSSFSDARLQSRVRRASTWPSPSSRCGGLRLKHSQCGSSQGMEEDRERSRLIEGLDYLRRCSVVVVVITAHAVLRSRSLNANKVVDEPMLTG
jgi:hypothetical protein